MLHAFVLLPGQSHAEQARRLAGIIDCNAAQPAYAWLHLSHEAGTLKGQIDITGLKKLKHIRGLQLAGTIDSAGNLRLEAVAGQRAPLALQGTLKADGTLLADSSGLKGCFRLIAAPISDATRDTEPAGILQRIHLKGRRLLGVDSGDCLDYAKWLLGGNLLQSDKKHERYNTRFADYADTRRMLGRDIAHWQQQDADKFRAFTAYCKKQVKNGGNAELTRLAKQLAGLGGWGPGFLRKPPVRSWLQYRRAEIRLRSDHFAELQQRLVDMQRASLAQGRNPDDPDPCLAAAPDSLEQVYACMMTASSEYNAAIERGGCIDFRHHYRRQLLRRGLALSEVEARLPDCRLFARAAEENTARFPPWQACFGYAPQPEKAHVERCLNAVMQRYYAGIKEPRGIQTGCKGLQAAYRKGVAAALPGGIEDTRDMADPDCKLVEDIRARWVAAATERQEYQQAERRRRAAEREANRQAATERARKEMEERKRLEEQRAIQQREAYARYKAQREEMLRQRRIAAEQQEQAAKERREAEIKARYYTDTPETLHSKHSDRERALMNAQGVIQVPDEYSEPSAEEIRLARMREIADRDGLRMVDGHLLYTRRFNRMKEMVGFDGHEGAEIRFSDATKLGCKPAPTVGYLCRYRISKTHKYDDYTRKAAARENNPGISFLFGMQEVLTSTLISSEVEGKVLEHWFVLTREGWRSPMTEAQKLELEQAQEREREWLRNETRKAEEKQRQQEQEDMIMDTWQR